MKKLPLFCVLFLAQIFAFSQSERLLRFSVVPTDNDRKALVRWTMSSGSTCSDLVVERSGNNSNFKEVYIYPSICGDADSAISYSWIDPNPVKLNTSFYRLKLDEIEFSLVSEFNFNSKLDNREIVLFPNPNTGFFSVEFTNTRKEKFDVFIFNSDGTLLFVHERLSGNSYAGEIDYFTSGIYFLHIKLENTNSRTIKLVIH